MKTIKITALIAPLFLCLLLCECSSHKGIAGNYTYQTECLGSELDGSITVKAWGTGSGRSDAIEQAKKNAVNDIVFKGLTGERDECSLRPLVSEVNARTRYESYFNKFFKDGGTYKHYISSKDESAGDKFSRDKKYAKQGVTYGIVLRVLRADLREKLIEDGILKQ